MGINLAWFAVEGADRHDLLARLGLEEAGDSNSEVSVRYACAEFPDGWFILTTKGSHRAFERALATASAGRLAIAGELSETVMASQTRAVRDGRQVWSVLHDPNKDLNGIEIEGEPPSNLGEILAKAQAAQKSDSEVDYIFDVPIELAAQICGYRPGDGACDWTVLQKTGGARPAARPKSLKAAAEAQLVPVIRALGWEPADRKHWFLRHADGMQQELWFDFSREKQTQIMLSFFVWRGDPSARTVLVQGRILPRRSLLPWWRRLFDLMTRPRPTADQRVDDAIVRALEEARAIDTFLRTGERQPYVDPWWGLAKDTWPELPEGLDRAPA